MDYANILKRTWKVMRTEKAVWLFALLAFTLTLFLLLLNPSVYGSAAALDATSPDYRPGLFLGLLCLFVILSWIIGPISVSGMVLSIQTSDGGEAVPLRETLAKALRSILRIWLLGLVYLVIIFFAGMVFLMGSLILQTIITQIIVQESASLGYAFLCLIPLLCLGLPIFVLVSRGMMLTYIALITGDLGVGEAISSTWALIRANLGPILIVSIIFLIIGIIGVVIYSVATAFASGTFNLFLSSPPDPSAVQPGPQTFLVDLGYYVYSFVIGVANYTFWTLFYLDLRSQATSVETLEVE